MDYMQLLNGVLLGMCTFFLGRVALKFDKMVDQVNGHETRITVIEKQNGKTN